MQSKVYFKGAGLMSGIGANINDTIKAIEDQSYIPSLIEIDLANETQQLPYFIIKQPGLEEGGARLYRIIDSVIQQAINEAGINSEQLSKTGLFIGSTSFDMFKCEESIKTTTRSDEDIDRLTPPFSGLSHYIQQRFNIYGPAYTFNTACTSSANALMYAAEFVRRGDLDHALVMGLEFFNEITALGFSGLDLISKSGMRPFESERDGLYLGEACGAVILSTEGEAGDFAFLSAANLGDNYSITASNPDGSNIHKLIVQAIERAKLNLKDIAIIKTHGTASLSNDEAEAAGLKMTFADNIPPIVILKPFIGHTLGACGINELILFYQSLKQNKLVSFPSNIRNEFSMTAASDKDIPKRGNYLLNYFGFGGNSTVLVISNA